MLAANLTEGSLRQNEDMRKISAWAAIIATPTLLAGIWGMNFEHMPEPMRRFGYPLAIAAMLIVEWLVTDELLVPPLVIFALMALLSVALIVRALGGIDEEVRAEARPLAVVA